MVADGKENLHPNSSQRHDLSPNIGIDTSKSTILGNYPFELLTSETTTTNNTTRPLLFSEILFNNSNGNHFSVTCTNSNSTNSTDSNLSINSSVSQSFTMNGLFNAGFNAPAQNMFGAIGSQAPLLSNSSSPTSTNSGEQHIDALLWLGAIGSAIPSSNTSPIGDIPSNVHYNSDGQYFSNVCGNCEGLTPENHCFDCSDSLCNRCVILHLRHFSNKHHTIQKINNISPPNACNRLPSFPSPNKADTENQCDIHYEVLRYVCEFCKTIVCQECSLRDHKDHQCTFIDKYVERPQFTIQILMEKAAMGKQQIKQNIDRILQFTQHLDRDTNDIIQRSRKNNMRTPNGNALSNAINSAVIRSEEQDRAIAEIIEKFRQQKLANFHDQTSGLRAALAGIASVTDDLKKMLNSLPELPPFEIAKALIDADNKIEHFLKQTRKLAPSPVNVNQFLHSLERKNDQQLVAGLQHLVQNNVNVLRPDIAALVAGTSQMNLLGNNNALGKSIRRPIVRSNRGFQQNNNAQTLLQPSLNQQISSLSSLSSAWSTPTLPNNDFILNGFNSFNTSPPQFGSNAHSVLDADPLAFGQCIFNSDAPVGVIQRVQATQSFAFDGSMEGQLSRPWGVCVDKDGNIIIGDRRNNRIQIFYPDGTFKFAFGSKGSGDGQLELPAGVTTDRQNRIIVADKDNHRIQIFSSNGRFILKFGGYGRDLGEFQYPWDVACNSIGNIIVTDTRNHRVQMFTSNGHFITKYSFDSAYYDKHLKSHITPRGVCFTPTGDILVTDFENHRIMKLDGNLTMVKMVRGREGEGDVHEFNRPSGLCCDDHGRVVVADSKNQRVLVYNTNFEFQWVLDVRRTLSQMNNEKDRPSDVAILPDGRIVVLFETSPDTKDCPHPMKTFVQIY